MAELLEELLALLKDELPGVEVRQAWGTGWGSRLLAGPVVTGELLSLRQGAAGQEAVVCLRVFGPQGQSRREAAALVEAAVLEHCPGCWEILRQEERVDSVTRLPCLPLRLSFGEGLEGRPVTLGESSFQAARVQVRAERSGRELIAVGEELPFAWEGARTAFQVEIQGLPPQALWEEPGFTAQVGDWVFTGCRWKQWDQSQGRGVFEAAGWEEKEEKP